MLSNCTMLSNDPFFLIKISNEYQKMYSDHVKNVVPPLFPPFL